MLILWAFSEPNNATQPTCEPRESNSLKEAGTSTDLVTVAEEPAAEVVEYETVEGLAEERSVIAGLCSVD